MDHAKTRQARTLQEDAFCLLIGKSMHENISLNPGKDLNSSKRKGERDVCLSLAVSEMSSILISVP